MADPADVRRSPPRPKARPKKNGWGGRRAGAGRPPSSDEPLALHRKLAPHDAAYPVHVTLRAGIDTLRTKSTFAAVRDAIAQSTRRAPKRARVTHFSVQRDRVELIAEAADRRALTDLMRSVTIRVALAVNAALGRSGSLWMDRWNGRTLRTPSDVREALLGMFGNMGRARRSASGGNPYASSVLPPETRLLRSGSK